MLDYKIVPQFESVACLNTNLNVTRRGCQILEETQLKVELFCDLKHSRKVG